MKETWRDLIRLLWGLLRASFKTLSPGLLWGHNPSLDTQEKTKLVEAKRMRSVKLAGGGENNTCSTPKSNTTCGIRQSLYFPHHCLLLSTGTGTDHSGGCVCVSEAEFLFFFLPFLRLVLCLPSLRRLERRSGCYLRGSERSVSDHKFSLPGPLGWVGYGSPTGKTPGEG